MKDNIFNRLNPNERINFEKRIAEQVEVGSVLLLNKRNSGFGGGLLNGISENDADFTHVIIITEKGPPIKFSHSTGHKFHDASQSGVETNVPLFEYLKGNYADVVITTPPEENRKKALERAKNILKDEKYTYSSTDAVLGMIGMRSQSSRNSFNCGAYVAEVLGLEKGEAGDLAVPSNWFTDERLKPSYLYTFYPEKQGS